MDEQVTLTRRCMKCNGMNTVFIRDVNININLTDSDIYRIVGDLTKQPYKVTNCQCCNSEHTLQMFVEIEY